MTPDLGLSVMVASRFVVLLLGAAVTALSWGAYRRTRARYLRAATLGFGLMTLGALVEGVLYHVVGLDLATVHVAESVLVALGFGVLLVSLRR